MDYCRLSIGPPNAKDDAIAEKGPFHGYQMKYGLFLCLQTFWIEHCPNIEQSTEFLYKMESS